MRAAAVLLLLAAGVQGEDKPTIEWEDESAANSTVNATAKPSKRAIELNDETFNEFIVTDGPLFVKFYLPTCRHCQEIAPIWEEIADHVNPKDGKPVQTDTKAKLVSVNCDENPKICRSVGLKGFPKLKLMGVIPKEGSYHAVVVEYKGKRTAAAMEKYIRGVQYIQEEKMKQETEEKKQNDQRIAIWKEREPALEKEAEEWNSKQELKDVTMGNVDKILEDATADTEEGVPLQHFALLLTDNGFDRSKYRGAWETAAQKVKHVEGVTFGTVNCQGGMARLCFNHPKIMMPYRFDIFPQMIVFGKKNKDGRVVDKAHKKVTYADLFKALKDDTVETRAAKVEIAPEEADEL